MADSSTNLDLLASAQLSPDVTANALFDPLSPATLFGRRANTTSALSWGYYGGKYRKADGTIITVANGTLSLTASATSYIKETDGVISVTTAAPSGWPGPLASNARALYAVVCSTSSVTSYTDYRTTGIGSGNASASSSVTTTGTPASGNITKFSGGSSITNGDLSGDVTTGGTLVTTIANNVVTYAKMQDVSATQRVIGRNAAGAGDPEEVTLSQLLDWIGSAAQGDILYRGASGWARLAAGTAGQFLKTAGAGANPSWADILAAINVFTKNQSVQTVALTDGATISVDASLSNNFKVTLGGNRTLANPTNLTEGMILNFAITQDGTGSRTLAYGTAFKFPGGAAPALSTAAGAKDFMSCYYDGSALLCNITKAYA